MSKSWICFVSFLFLTPAAFAQSVELVSVFQSGAGCYSEDTHTALKSSNIEISFSNFDAALEPFVTSTTAMTSCKWTAKLNVPAGYALVVRGGVFAGTASLLEQAKTSFHSEIILDGRDHEASSFLLSSSTVHGFQHDSSKYVNEMFGRCGGPSEIRFNATMFLRSIQDSRIFISESRLNSLSIPYRLVKCK